MTRCWCGWYPMKPRHLFGSHLDWHLWRVRIANDMREALCGS